MLLTSAIAARETSRKFEQVDCHIVELRLRALSESGAVTGQLIVVADLRPRDSAPEDTPTPRAAGPRGVWFRIMGLAPLHS